MEEQMDTQADSPQVLVVGAGPVGLILAIDLARRGVDVQVIERSTERRKLPKMERCNARTMEIFRRLGIADRVRAASKFTPLPMDVFVATSLIDPPLLHLRYPSALEAKEAAKSSHDGALPLEASQLISQYTLEPLLRDVAEDLGITIRTGWELTSFSQEPTQVKAQVAHVDGYASEIVAQYMVGCDGGVSTVRKQLGIPLEGRGRLARILQIFFRSDKLFDSIEMGKGRHYYFPRGSLVVQDDLKHFMVNVVGVDDDADPIPILEDVLKLSVDIEVLATNPWWTHLLVAEQYQVDRVLLAGDAIHLVIPQGGLGMNTGVGDAIDLSWKLAGTLEGWGGPELLKSYQIERKPIAIRNKDAARVAMKGVWTWQTACTPDMRDDTPSAEAVRAKVAELAIEGQRIGHEMTGIDLGYRYDHSPIIVSEDGDAPDANAFAYSPSTWPGSRIPNGWLSEDVPLSDKVGLGYTLLVLSGESFDFAGFEQSMRQIGAPFEILRIPDPALRDLYERNLILLRPDLHVAWRGDSVPDSTDQVVSVVTGHGPALRSAST
jgi:2-polyprenyl-6-methoxyphenol hydroxylase-like FAD-dependent oxidoreductase